MKPPRETTGNPAQAAWWSCPGVVYFFAAGNPPVAIKIGVAALTGGCGVREAIVRRMRALQTSNHEKIELLGVIVFTSGRYPTRDAEVLERELHIRFARQQRFKPHTRGAEWFTPSDELFDYIDRHTETPAAFEIPISIAQNVI